MVSSILYESNIRFIYNLKKQQQVIIRKRGIKVKLLYRAYEKINPFIICGLYADVKLAGG